MPNTLLTPVEVTRESLVILHTMTTFIAGINREYSKQFGQAGAKIGSTINVRLPNRYYVSDGAALDPQNTAETYVPLTLNHQWHVDMQFTTMELTLSLDDFSKRIIAPAIRKLTTYIDWTGLAQVLNIYNNVGTAGTTPGTTSVLTTLGNTGSPQIYLNAGALLDAFAAPDDGMRQIVITPIANSISVAGLSGLFNAQEIISEQYKKGVLVPSLGFRFYRDQNINYLTTGTHAISGSTPTVNAANQTGASLTTAGWTDGTTQMTVGETFTIAGVYSCNPENQQSTGLLANFTVTAAVASGGGVATIAISPSIIVAAANVANGTVMQSPALNATITFTSGAASTAYPVMIANHRDAFTLGTADLEMPDGVHFAGRENFEGVSMRLVRQYLINSDQIPCRVDVLGGFTTLRPELGVRILG